jgi:hypothetical protein
MPLLAGPLRRRTTDQRGNRQGFSIAELAECVAKVVGYHGKVCGDSNKPDGTPRKLLDVQRLTDLGWQAKISLVEGFRSTYEWFLEHQADYRGANSGSSHGCGGLAKTQEVRGVS